ncbi:hypothetical protein ACIPRI_23630 [Variovorax sp. LARHSF232]
MSKILIALFGLYFLTLADGQPVKPSKEQALRVIQTGLRTCSMVANVQREDSLYRIYNTISGSSEFDLNDMSSSTIGGILLIKCEAMGCVTNRVQNYSDKTWIERAPANELILSCSSDAGEKLDAAIRYYRANF